MGSFISVVEQPIKSLDLITHDEECCPITLKRCSEINRLHLFEADGVFYHGVALYEWVLKNPVYPHNRKKVEEDDIECLMWMHAHATTNLYALDLVPNVKFRDPISRRIYYQFQNKDQSIVCQIYKDGMTAYLTPGYERVKIEGLDFQKHHCIMVRPS